MKKKLNVVSVVVTYNAYTNQYMPICMDKLLAIKLSNDRYEVDHKIVIVDSHSPDSSGERLMKDYHDKALVIASDTNLGYAGGNNEGFKATYESEQPDYYCVVTQDVQVTPDWLLEAIEAAEQDEKIAIVQPLLLLSNKEGLINSTGNLTHFLGYGYTNDYLLPEKEYTNREVKDICYASGAVLLLRADVLMANNGFDDEMWMYNEDQDLSWRFWVQGYRSVLAPKSRCFHQYEFSMRKHMMYWMDRNRVLNVLQNYHWATVILILPPLLANELAGFLFALTGGWLTQKLRMWGYFLKPSSWRLLMKKRRAIQKKRVLKDREVTKLFVGKILFQDLTNPIVRYIGNPVLHAYWTMLRFFIFW